jgi:hypothetical protein
VKGDGTQYTLAVWTDGTYAYSIELSDGVGIDVWEAYNQGCLLTAVSLLWSGNYDYGSRGEDWDENGKKGKQDCPFPSSGIIRILRSL